MLTGTAGEGGPGSAGVVIELKLRGAARHDLVSGSFTFRVTDPDGNELATGSGTFDGPRLEGLMGSNNAGAAGGGAIYGLGIFGAWVYYWQQADAFWEYAYAIFQGLFWPAYMVYEAFGALGG